jgi:hypothetical protein
MLRTMGISYFIRPISAALTTVGTALLISVPAMAQPAAGEDAAGEDVPADAAGEEVPAEAAEEEVSATVADPAPAEPAADAPAATSPDADGPRFRGGISGFGGGLFVSGISLGMGGVDGRLGVQINDLIGIYAHPTLGVYGGGTVSGSGSVGGLVGATAMVDFTFIDQLFVGAGGGYAVLNNPHGPELQFRLGGYPVVGDGIDGIRRKGLMLAADLRVFFVEGSTFISPTASIGYEAF